MKTEKLGSYFCTQECTCIDYCYFHLQRCTSSALSATAVRNTSNSIMWRGNIKGQWWLWSQPLISVETRKWDKKVLRSAWRKATHTTHTAKTHTMLLSSASVCNVIFFSPLGNTYDRSIIVDEEEASIMLYDIWEQVSYLSFMWHLHRFLDIWSVKDGISLTDSLLLFCRITASGWRNSAWGWEMPTSLCIQWRTNQASRRRQSCVSSCAGPGSQKTYP